MQEPELVLRGRKFVPAGESTTFEQDLYIMDHVRASGVEQIEFTQADRGPKLAAKAEQVVLQAYRTGQLFHILAGILVEEGKLWSVESANENAKFFAGLNTVADKKAIQGSVVAVILSFFVNEEGSFVISPKSSSDEVGTGEGQNDEVTEDHITLETSKQL